MYTKPTTAQMFSKPVYSKKPILRTLELIDVTRGAET